MIEKLSNGELVQLQLSRDKDDRRYAVVCGIGYKLTDPKTREVAFAVAQRVADKVIILP